MEVAWRGKFRLESLEIYNGMAWWLAKVVRKCDNKPGVYQVTRSHEFEQVLNIICIYLIFIIISSH